MSITTGYPKEIVIVAALLLLVFEFPQARADSDQIIKQAIEQAAADTPELQGTDASVAVEGRIVILFGSVRLYLHKMLYEEIAWKTLGVVAVDNEIRIVPLAPLSDAEIEQEIWKIVNLREQIFASALEVTVARGAVFLSGTFIHPQDVIDFKKRVGAIEGVIAIAIDVAFRV